MNADQADIGALIFIGIIIIANLVTYAIARGAAKGEAPMEVNIETKVEQAAR